MQYTYTARATFETTHRAYYPGRCNLEHGHKFALTASVRFDQVDKGIPRGTFGLDEKVEWLAKEFDHRNLEVQMPGDSELGFTVVQLAAYFWERLAGEFKNLYEVSVDDGSGACGTVTTS